MEKLTSFILGLATAAIVWYVKETKDENKARVNDLCGTIEEAANLSTQYWLKPPWDQEIKQMEAVILGRQHQVLLLLDLLGKSDWSLPDLCESELENYLDSLTGGNFEVRGRSQDIGRAKDVQVNAANLIVRVRHLHQKARRYLPF